MEKIKIITDSTAYLTKEYADNENITIVPLSYLFEEKSYKEGYSGEFEEYFKKLKSSNSFPTTSQPATGDLFNAFEDAIKEYDKVIGIFLSSKLSGTYNNASLAREMIESDRKEDIYVIDSELSVAALRFLIEDAVSMIEQGKECNEIINHINKRKNDVNVYLTTGSLEYLSRGGRLSSLEYKVGNLLKIKPIIELKDGELGLIDKVHGKKKALNNIMDRVHEDVKRITICQILCMDEAHIIREKLLEKFPHAKVTIEDIGPVIGSHLGPETVGICYY